MTTKSYLLVRITNLPLKNQPDQPTHPPLFWQNNTFYSFFLCKVSLIWCCVSIKGKYTLLVHFGLSTLYENIQNLNGKLKKISRYQISGLCVQSSMIIESSANIRISICHIFNGKPNEHINKPSSLLNKAFRGIFTSWGRGCTIYWCGDIASWAHSKWGDSVNFGPKSSRHLIVMHYKPVLLILV